MSAALIAARHEAVAAFTRGDFADAARRLVSLLARTAPDASLLRLCGMALVRSDAVRQGLPYLARARRLAPGDPVAALWHGIGLLAADQATQAVATLEGCVVASPDDPAPLVHLSRALLRLARADEALVAARRAVVLAPELADAEHAVCLAGLKVAQQSAVDDPARLADAWLALGQACLRLDKVGDARVALSDGLALRPGHAETEAALALVEHLCGEPVTAVVRLRDVLQRHPRCVPARLNLAACLVLENQPEAALSLLEGEPPSMQPDGNRWLACRITTLVATRRHEAARADFRRVRPPVEEVEIVLRWQHAMLERADGRHDAAAALVDRVAELASHPGAARLQDRIDAQFNLAWLRHVEGRHERAFEHWSRGHALLRSAQPFSREAHATVLDAVIRDGGTGAQMQGAGAARSDRAPVFIVGLPRTGTTLTEQILSARADVHGAGERLAVRDTLVAMTGTQDAVEAAHRIASLDAGALAVAAEGYLAALRALAPEARIVLDKMPENIMHLGFVARLLPGARVICCTRDLRDVGTSIFQHRFLGHHPYAHEPGDLGWYIAQHERLRAHWRETLSIPMLELDHADWIGDFDATLRRVLDFLELPWDAASERFFEQDRPVRTASRDQVRRPINADGVGRWRAYATQLAPMLRELPR